jgi:AcrR family transcriptional regulator
MTRPDQASLAAQAAHRAVDARVRSSELDVRRLLDAGLALMAAGGADKQPRITDIIRAAGLSNQAFYRYFASKDDLVAAVVDDGERRLVAYVQRQLAAADAPEQALRVFVEAVSSQASDPAVADATRAVLWNATRTIDVGGVRSRQLHDLLAALLVEPLRARGSADPARDAAVITGAVTSFMLDHLWRQTAPSSEDVEHLVRFCQAGLGGTAP